MTVEPGPNYRRFPPYVAYLGLTRAPFAGHDEAALFRPAAFEQRLEMLVRMTAGEALVYVIGEHDGGKSTLLNTLLERLGEGWRVCRIDADPMTDPVPLGGQLGEAFGDGGAGGLERLPEWLDVIEAGGGWPLLVVDNAHLLPERSLELVLRLHREMPQLRVLLFTEPQIKIALNALDPGLTEGIAAHNLHLKGYTEAELRDYLAHRLHLAGLAGELPFSDKEVRAIHQESQGLPGRINKVAHRMLLEHVLAEKGATAAAKGKAAAAAPATPAGGRGRRWRLIAVFAGLGVALAAGVGLGWLRASSPGGEIVQPLPLPATPPPLAEPAPVAEPEATPQPEAEVAAGETAEAAAEVVPEAEGEPQATAEVVEPPAEAVPESRDEAEAVVEAPAVTLAATPAPAVTEAPAAGPRGAEWLLAQTGEGYVVQLLNSATREGALEFIRKHGLAERVCYIPLADGQHLVLQGPYQWNRDARGAIEALPAELRALKPWSRNLSQVQALIRGR